MNYLGTLRQFVGHRPLLMIGATVLVLDRENRFLLLKRVDNAFWRPPGGVVELGEVVESAAKRETLEETGLEDGKMTLLSVFSGPEQFYCDPNGDQVHVVAMVYTCADFSGELRLSDEHTEAGSFMLSEIPEELSPPIKPIIKYFRHSSSLPEL